MVSAMYPASDLAHAKLFPQPPRLYWALVLVLQVVTLGYFGLVWLYVQARWVRKVRGRSRTMRWLIAFVAVYPVSIAVTILLGIVLTVARIPFDQSVVAMVAGFTDIVLVLFKLTTVYTLRNELAEPPINLATSKIMALFFGEIYFQYVLRKFRFENKGRMTADSTLDLSIPQ